jgi:hypothetical protein
VATDGPIGKSADYERGWGDVAARPRIRENCQQRCSHAAAAVNCDTGADAACGTGADTQTRASRDCAIAVRSDCETGANADCETGAALGCTSARETGAGAGVTSDCEAGVDAAVASDRETGTDAAVAPDRSSAAAHRQGRRARPRRFPLRGLPRPLPEPHRTTDTIRRPASPRSQRDFCPQGSVL